MLRLIFVIAAVASLAACSTRLNPFNWFGGDREERLSVEDASTGPVDPRGLVAEVLELDVDPTPQGAIVRAMGLPPTQGYWEADLLEVERTESTIVYEFRVFPPVGPTRVSTQQSREVVTGTEITNARLVGIRTITVVGAQNRRTVTRR